MHYLSQTLAILLTLFILILWNVHKKTGTSNESIFLLLIIVALVSEALDLATQFAIAPHPISNPEIVTNIVIKAYLVSVVAYIFSMGLYVDKIIKESNKVVQQKTNFIIISIIVLIVISIATCILKVDYLYHPECSMMQGPAVVFVMMVAIVACVFYLYLLLIRTKNVSSWNRIITSVWLIMFVVGTALQFLTIGNIHLPMISINVAAGIMFLFLCNENPGSKFDYNSECFYYETFVEYLQDVLINNIDQACLMVSIRVKNKDNLVYSKEIFDNLINNKEFNDLKFFKGADSELYVSAPRPELLKRIESDVVKQIVNIEKKNNQVKLYTTMVVIPDVKIVNSYQVIKALFDSYRTKGINDSESIEEKYVDNQMIEEYKHRFTVVENIERAVRQGKVVVDYQLISDNASDNVYVQANSNIHLDDGSVLTTSDYYELAVEYDQLKDIREIKLKSINSTIRTIIANKNNRLATIFLHTSVQELEDESYYDEFLNAFYGDDAVLEKTCLEITNIDTIVNKDVLLNNIVELQKHGVKFAIAGFGSGEANLNYFIDLPIQFVRFDRSIIDNAIKEEHALMIMKDVTALAHSLNFNVIAVGNQNDEFNRIINECDIHMSFDETTPMINESKFIDLCLESKGGKE